MLLGIGLSACLLGTPAVAAENAIVRSASAAEASAGDQGLGFAKTSVVVVSETDNTDASILLSRARDFYDGGHVGFTNWSLKATVPLEDDKKTGLFVTDAGLAHVNALEFSWSWVRAPSLPDAVNPGQILDRAAEACRKDTKANKEDCESKDSERLRRWMPPADEAQMFPLVDKDHRTTALSLTGGLGAKSYKHRDPVSLTEVTADRTPWSLGVQYGGAGQNSGAWRSGWYVGAGGEYKRTYKAADSRTLCQAPPPTGPQECFTGAYGRPKEQLSKTVFVLARKQNLWDAFDMNWAVQVKPAYDFESEAAGLEVTLYVLADKDDKLRGGLRGKLQGKDKDPLTDDETSTVAIFVGSAF
jgi:hypothetical protein